MKDKGIDTIFSDQTFCLARGLEMRECAENGEASCLSRTSYPETRTTIVTIGEENNIREYDLDGRRIK